MSRNLIALPVAVVAVLAATGCGSGGPAEEASTSEPVATTGSPSPTEEPTPTEELSPTEEARPTDDTPLEAADGTDLDACFDGTCEVVVEAGTGIGFDDKFDVGTVQVTAITDDGVTLVLRDGMSSTSFGVGGGGASGGADGTELLGYTLMSVSGDTAIIAFYPEAR
ncbi:hypothetical protein AB0K52_12665 [Glycomyces sp. NPDC049804]|uniref:hypothetical protein n=1 Tax=Glycomyces sp. NPDC049804 TaxID=3154363 RepID=UPI00344652E8